MSTPDQVYNQKVAAARAKFVANYPNGVGRNRADCADDIAAMKHAIVEAGREWEIALNFPGYFDADFDVLTAFK